MNSIVGKVYYLGSSGCAVYLVATSERYVLIDAGMSLNVLSRISDIGENLTAIGHCIITHFHIDHTATLHDLKTRVPDLKVYAHELDAFAIEEPNHDKQTAANWYNVAYKPVALAQKFKRDSEILTIGKREFQIIHTPGHTPGSICVLVEEDTKKILFGQDIHGPFNADFGSDLAAYQRSMQKLLDIGADILCEGHYGIIEGKEDVRDFILHHKRANSP